MNRRDFGRAVGAGALVSPFSQAAKPAYIAARGPAEPVGSVKAVFSYPPTSKLREEGYYSWPGSSFDAEGRQKEYSAALQRVAAELNLRMEIERKPIDTKADVESFLASLKTSRPDGLLLIPFKKSHADNLFPIIDNAGLPAVVFGVVGVLLNPQLREFSARPKTILINSLEDITSVRQALKLIQTRRRMADSTIVNLAGTARRESRVPHLGTRVQQVPLQDFYDLYAKIGNSEEVNVRAARYMREAVRILEPSQKDVYESAKCYPVLKAIVQREKADAMMMTCLPGLRQPHKHVPPCMGFMDMRDEGIPTGCESDLDATLTMMLIQFLFDRPAFQHNPTADTERNVYFGAHCTSAARMHGPDGPRESYALRSHAEAGWGCVPQVLFSAGQKVTFGKYHSQAKPPNMVIYSGTIAGCPANPPAGGCRTNLEVKLDGVEPMQVKSHHLCLCYGENAAQLRAFCRMHDITATA
ncbi:MAG: hypothetical protein ACE15B_06950 [Bryobacteraceae bacterium]